MTFTEWFGCKAAATWRYFCGSDMAQFVMFMILQDTYMFSLRQWVYGWDAPVKAIVFLWPFFLAIPYFGARVVLRRYRRGAVVVRDDE